MFIFQPFSLFITFPDVNLLNSGQYWFVVTENISSTIMLHVWHSKIHFPPPLLLCVAHPYILDRAVAQ